MLNWKLLLLTLKQIIINLKINFQYLAANVKFSAISSISVTPDAILYIADQGNYRLRAVSSSIPPEKSDGVFEVPDTDAQELYIFNKFGQHVLTRDIMTGNIVYKLAYTQATSNGKLMSVTDAHGKTLTLTRDYRFVFIVVAADAIAVVVVFCTCCCF